MNKIAHLLSSVFYIGYFPIASGTFGSFIALVCWWFVPNGSYQFSLIIAIIIIGTYCSYLTEKNYKTKDPSFIVIDEFVGMFISLLLLPKDIYFYLVAFILFRIFDILKPSYIGTVQKYQYGIGVMADDILAGILSCIIINMYIYLI